MFLTLTRTIGVLVVFPREKGITPHGFTPQVVLPDTFRSNFNVVHEPLHGTYVILIHGSVSLSWTTCEHVPQPLSEFMYFMGIPDHIPLFDPHKPMWYGELTHGPPQ